MFRKMLVIAAAVAMPASAFAGVSAIAASGVAGATPIVATANCKIGGSVTFGAGGISEGANVTTATTSTSTSALTKLTGSTASCQSTTETIKVIQPTQKCSVTTLAAIPSGALAGYTPGHTKFPLCVAHATYSQSNSGWGFAGGVKKSGVYVSTTGGIKTALHAGIKYKDNGVLLTLLVSTVAAVNPGGACGSDAGFTFTGTVSGASTHHWSTKLCLAGDTGTATTNSFINDLTAELVATHNDTTTTSDATHIAKALVDGTQSTLTIS